MDDLLSTDLCQNPDYILQYLRIDLFIKDLLHKRFRRFDQGISNGICDNADIRFKIACFYDPLHKRFYN